MTQIKKAYSAGNKPNDTVSILDFGADPTGSTFINTAWRDAMESFSDGKGGTLIVPPGTYLVEPTFRAAGDLDKQLDFPYDNVTVDLQGNLQVDTHDNRYLILLFGRRRGSTSTTPNRVKNIRLTGTGSIIGDRATHSPVDTNYGFGLWLGNCEDSSIDGAITIKDVFGDGIMADALPYGPADGDENNKSTPKNITLSDTSSKNSFRNNFTGINGDNVVSYACNYNGANGGAPEAGVGIEPEFHDVVEEFYCRDFKFLFCDLSDNGGSGCEVVDTSAGKVDSVTVFGCNVKRNGSASNGFGGLRAISIDGEGSVKFLSNEVTDNFGLGIDLDGASSGGVNANRRLIVHDNFVSRTFEGTKEAIQMGYGISARSGVIGASIKGNTVELCDHHGIYIESLTAVINEDIDVAGNFVYSNSQKTDVTFDNIHIGLNCSLINIQNNMVRKDTQPVPVTNKPAYGIQVKSDFCEVINNDVFTGGETGNLLYPFAMTTPDDGSRNGIVSRNPGFVNENSLRSAPFSVTATGPSTIVIAHGLDTHNLSNATIAGFVRSQISLSVQNEGTLSGTPFVVTMLKDLDDTNITIAYDVLTAGSGGDTCRILVKVTPPMR